MNFRHTAMVFALASSIGCYNLTGRRVVDGGDAADAPRADALDASDVGDVADGPEAPDSMDALDVADVSAVDGADAVDADETHDASDVADVADVVEPADVTDATDACALTRCGALCVDTAIDRTNCGTCGNACPVPSNGVAACASGRCGVLCDAGFHLCAGRCVDDTLVTNCGARCEPCALAAHAATTCSSGACGFTCDANFADCDGDATNGCETDTRTSGAHCGRCSNACTAPAGSVASCVAGRCEVMLTCSAGQVLCGAACQTVGATCTVGVGACERTGTTVCSAAGGSTTCSVTPGASATETCDGIDNDCDGLTDEGFCRIGGVCFTDGQANPANACLRCLAPPTASGPTAWSNASAGTICRAAAGPCDVEERCGGAGAPCPADAFVVGSTSYIRSTPALSLISACAAPGHETYLPVADDNSVSVTLPFVFRFFGAPFSSVGLSTNGVVSFPWNGNIREYFNQALPYAGIPDAIFAFWDDMMTGSDGICVATTGSAPNRQFVAQWSNSNFCCADDPATRLNFEVVLSEGTGSIDVRFGDMGVAPRSSGDSATIGIQQGSGAAYDLVSYNTAGSAITGRSYRWTPAGTVCRPTSSIAACDPAEICSGTSAGCPSDLVMQAPTAEICDGVDNNCDGVVDEAAAVAACPARTNATSTCAAGACGFACNTGFADCDGVAANGCENSGACRPCVESWRPLPDGPAVWGANCTWTGRELLVWGGIEGTAPTNRGWRFDPVTNAWTAMAPAPISPRTFPFAVWTGSEYWIWGGEVGPAVSAADGARYDPRSDRWTLLPTSGAPGPRHEGAQVWAGNRVVVWGGGAPTARTPVNTGGRYDPVADRWASASTTGAPSARQTPAGLWTGTEMLVWGGQFFDGSRYIQFADGGRYDPVLDRWTAMSNAGAPPGSAYISAVWTGAEALFWGGLGGSGVALASGGRYNPATNRWSPMSTVGAPSARGQTGAVWTGAEMVLFGGNPNVPPGGFLADGAAYVPATDSWRALPPSSLGRRAFNCIAWTGTEVIIQGGFDSSASGAIVWRDGARYVPASPGYPRMTCGTTCVNVQNDPSNCGACGRLCTAGAHATAACNGGACARRCDAGFADCDSTATNGCETDLANDANNCGGCGRACPTGTPCLSGVCTRQTSCPTPSEIGCGMVVVPSTMFTLGQVGARLATPVIAGVSVAEFALDSYEVTVARFRRFWAAGHPGVPGRAVLYPETVSLPWLGDIIEPTTNVMRAVCNWSSTPGSREDHPINCIDWYTAQAFCVWDGGRLPTEAEHELAARTFAGLSYPWGESAPASQVCWSGGGVRTTTCPVGSFAPMRGFFDITGNLWERVADNEGVYGSGCWGGAFRTRNPLCATDSTGARVMRGGAFDATDASWLRGAARGADPATGQDSNAGLRCARSR